MFGKRNFSGCNYLKQVICYFVPDYFDGCNDVGAFG